VAQDPHRIETSVSAFQDPRTLRPYPSAAKDEHGLVEIRAERQSLVEATNLVIRRPSRLNPDREVIHATIDCNCGTVRRGFRMGR